MSTTNPLQQGISIILVMLLAFYIQELPTSNALQMTLPEWPFVLMLYFSVSSRYFFGMISAFLIGLVQDVFLGVPTLGLHAAIYVLAAFIIMSMRMRFRHMSIFSQSVVVGLLVLLKIILIMVYEAVFYAMPNHFWSVLSIPLSMLLWPAVHLFFSFFSTDIR